MREYQEPVEIILFPDDPAATELLSAGPDEVAAVVRRNMYSSLCWAILAEGALTMGTVDGDLSAYAFAFRGREVGLDIAEQLGWISGSRIPWEHVPNQGFLRCWWALAVAAHRLGDMQERDWAAQVVRTSSEQGFEVLSSRFPMA